MTKKSKQDDHFQLEWHGNCVVVIPSANIEHLSWDVIDGAAQIVMQPLEKTKAPTMVFDLSHVGYFGSIFLALLLRCHKRLKERGGELVVCAPTQMARHLLSVTALDTLWPIYETRDEALADLEI
ncbi:MAG: STAS domain-containing protein [Planctomycetaceae bacterium]|jgi:anti-anti-sigma factor